METKQSEICGAKKNIDTQPIKATLLAHHQHNEKGIPTKKNVLFVKAGIGTTKRSIGEISFKKRVFKKEKQPKSENESCDNERKRTKA